MPHCWSDSTKKSTITAVAASRAGRDDPHRATSVWRHARELSGGTIEVAEELPEAESAGTPVVFDPTRVVDGIELSDDPILHYRPSAYSESVSRRTSAEGP